MGWDEGPRITTEEAVMRRAARRLAGILQTVVVDLEPANASSSLLARSLAGSQCLREAGSRASLASTSGRPWAASASRHAPAGLRAEIPAVKLAKASFTSVVSEESKLTSSEIQQLLDAAGVDYRDCVEKQDLILRLREAQPRLPPYVRARLSALLNSRGAGAVTQQPTSVPAEVVQDLSPEELGSIAVFKTCSKSAVHITTHAAVQRPFSTDIMEIPAGTGSGFVWDDQGHIVTNYHVVQRMSRGGIIRATLSDGTVVPAQIVGVEPERDLAVLRALETPQRGRLSGWVPVMLGSSGKLQVGQRVFAIGNPFGLDQTLTTGIVSGLGREVTGVAGNKIRDVIQTDAAINPGNSGGPLLDSRGRLIGVNTMIFSTSGMFAGVGFAIPVDTVRRVVNQLIKYGRVRKAGIGAFCLPDATARNLGRDGVVVQSVMKGSGADQAGLHGLRTDASGRVVVMDEIIAVGGERVHTVEDLMTALEAFDAGDVCTLSVRRATGSVDEVQVRLQERMPLPG